MVTDTFIFLLLLLPFIALYFQLIFVCMSSSLLLPEYTEPTDFWDKCAPIALLMKDFL